MTSRSSRASTKSRARRSKRSNQVRCVRRHAMIEAKGGYFEIGYAYLNDTRNRRPQLQQHWHLVHAAIFEPDVELDARDFQYGAGRPDGRSHGQRRAAARRKLVPHALAVQRDSVREYVDRFRRSAIGCSRWCGWWRTAQHGHFVRDGQLDELSHARCLRLQHVRCGRRH